ncbi:chromodomain y-like protein [Plakobranchus ocellatus]|uniref:Chromodomain y-like protein n=1 Tax=Plakobranchus ocellatus TaxID=259542 RepID=A0AAV3Y2N9_9GAST|nr:chromodomain y-like protein [Plakobranchus ocellatus]
MATFSDDEKYEVEAILEQRKRKGNIEYLVRWKGAGDGGSDSWEPAKTLVADCAVAVQAFLSKSKASKAKRSTSRSRKVSRSRSRSSSRSRRSRSSSKTPNKSQSQTRSRGRSGKEEDKKPEETSETTTKTSEAITVNSSSSDLTDSKSLEKGSPEKKSEEAMPAEQRVLRSSTVEARKHLEVQRVHNDQRPVREDDNKPRSAIWKVADYAVIVLFVLSLIAAFILFLEKIFDLEGFKNQAYPNMGVLKRRLLSAQQQLVDLVTSGATAAADAWLYLLEQVKGTEQAGGSTDIPKQTSAPGA